MQDCWKPWGTRARLYAPNGVYWRDNFVSPTGLYVNQGDLIFTACQFDMGLHEGDYNSDFDNALMLEEVRLLAALVLSIGWNEGMIVLHPLSATVGFKEYIDLADPEAIDRVGSAVRREFPSYRNWAWTEGPPPPAFGGDPYEYREQGAPLSLQRRIYDAIDVSDHLLLRGLAELIKAPMFIPYPFFGEHAHYSLFIAYASFQLVLRKLRRRGITNPSSADAQALMEDTFGDDGEETGGMKYFKEDYDDRIKSFHPQSRFGVFPYAPLMYNHFYGLYYDLREVYRWLILDEWIKLGER
jgi:hypothetical protein